MEKLGQGNAKDFRNQAEIQDGQVSLTAFDRTDERAVQPAALGQLGLGPLASGSQFPDAKAQSTQKSGVVQIHA